MNNNRHMFYSYKNTAALWWVIPLTILLLLIQESIPYIIILWVWYLCYCHKNNKDLSYDSEIIQDRKKYLESVGKKVD